MDRKSKAFLALFGIVSLLFLVEMVQIFMLRFEFGDVYPPYSSFRSDPLGVRAFYSAAGSVEGISASRNIEPVTRLENGADTTLFFCGSSMSRDPEETIEAIESLVAEGGRLVIAFFPVRKEPRPWYNLGMDDQELEEEDNQKEKENSDKNKKCDGGDEGEEKECKKGSWLVKLVSIEDRWGFKYAYTSLPGATDEEFGEVQAEKRSGPGDLPEEVSWHTALYFDRPEEKWRVIYSWEGHAVLMERRWGRGSIVLSSDSYFLSNQAMRDERHPSLLSWLIGPSSKVIFDETHLGVVKQSGIMVLIRKYRLDGALWVVALLALLFVWKNSISLVPKSAGREREDARLAKGRDSAAGLVNLLRRSIPMREIVPACVEEWRKTFSREGKVSEAKLSRINAVAEQERRLPIRQRDPVKAYRAISAILAEKD